MKLPERYRYIVVEGPIGVGKTTLARAISEASGASLMLEDPNGNPFLPRFYENAERYALPTQLFFSLSAHRPARDAQPVGSFSPCHRG